MIEPFKAQLHAEMAQKLTATDALMRENIAKLVRSKVSASSEFVYHLRPSVTLIPFHAAHH